MKLNVKRIIFLLLIAGFVSCFFLAQAPTNSLIERPEITLPIRSTPKIIAAGVPRIPDMMSHAHAVFSQLAAHHILYFYPTFQYQEVPESLTLGYEFEFLSPCDQPTLLHTTLRDAGVRLIIPAEILYPVGDLPTFAADPLRALIECIGRSQIEAIVTYDEPVHREISVHQVRALYERIKQIDNTLPIIMIHAPVLADSEGTQDERFRQEYLAQVKTYSQYADVVGFDVYGVPTEIAQLSGPYAAGTLVSYDQAIEEYLVWLHDQVPEKGYAMVYQAFAFADQYDPELVQTLPAELVDRASVRPTITDVARMMELARMYGVSYVSWWGQSFTSEPTETWEAILSESKRARDIMFPANLKFHSLPNTISNPRQSIMPDVAIRHAIQPE